MQIQPITAYSSNKYYTKKIHKSEEPDIQPNFKGLKGFLAGGAVGAGLTAAGVILTAGAGALPMFMGYIALNGGISAVSGHLIQNQNKNK